MKSNKHLKGTIFDNLPVIDGEQKKNSVYLLENLYANGVTKNKSVWTTNDKREKGLPLVACKSKKFYEIQAKAQIVGTEQICTVIFDMPFDSKDFQFSMCLLNETPDEKVCVDNVGEIIANTRRVVSINNDSVIEIAHFTNGGVVMFTRNLNDKFICVARGDSLENLKLENDNVLAQTDFSECNFSSLKEAAFSI